MTPEELGDLASTWTPEEFARFLDAACRAYTLGVSSLARIHAAGRINDGLSRSTTAFLAYVVDPNRDEEF